MNKTLMNLLLLVLPVILSSATPELKAMLAKCLNDLEAKAKSTSNPFDDMLIAFLKGVLNVP